MIQDRHDANAIDLTVGGPGLPREISRSVCGHNRITGGLGFFVCLFQQGGGGGGRGLVLL